MPEIMPRTKARSQKYLTLGQAASRGFSVQRRVQGRTRTRMPVAEGDGDLDGEQEALRPERRMRGGRSEPAGLGGMVLVRLRHLRGLLQRSCFHHSIRGVPVLPRLAWHRPDDELLSQRLRKLAPDSTLKSGQDGTGKAQGEKKARRGWLLCPICHLLYRPKEGKYGHRTWNLRPKRADVRHPPPVHILLAPHWPTAGKYGPPGFLH